MAATGDPTLDGLLEVFPLINFSTLIDVSIQFKDDIDAAAEYVIQNVLPNIVPDPNGPSTNEDFYIHGEVRSCSAPGNFEASGHEHAFNDPGNHLGINPVDDNRNSNYVQFDITNKIVVDSMQDRSHDSLEVDGNYMQHLFSERNPEISALHDDGSSDEIRRSRYFVNLESLDGLFLMNIYKTHLSIETLKFQLCAMMVHLIMRQYNLALLLTLTPLIMLFLMNSTKDYFIVKCCYNK